jgi:hypothetical protein
MTGPSIHQITQMALLVLEQQRAADADEQPTEVGTSFTQPATSREVQPTAAAQAVAEAGWVPAPRPTSGDAGITIGTVIIGFVLGCFAIPALYLGTLATLGPAEPTIERRVDEEPPEPTQEKGKSKSKGKAKNQ